MNAVGRLVSKLSAAWLMVLATLLFAGMGVCVRESLCRGHHGRGCFFRGFVGAIMMGALAWWQA